MLENLTQRIRVDTSREELKRVFATKARTLIDELEAWFDQETAAIDG
jgi:hypothetical protein